MMSDSAGAPAGEPLNSFEPYSAMRLVLPAFVNVVIALVPGPVLLLWT